MGMDFGLITLLLLVFGCCVVNPIFRATSSPWSPAPSPWNGRDSGQSANPLLHGSGASNPFAPDMLNSGARGRLVDVKPGDLRGAGAGGSFFGGCNAGGGWMQGPNSMDWNQSATGLGAGHGAGGGGWSSTPTFGNGGAGAFGSGGTWAIPWQAMRGAQSPSVAGGGTSGLVSNLGSTLQSAFGSVLGSAFGVLGGSHSSGANTLPTEAEVTETYAHFGVELQAWAPALAAVVDREIVERVLSELDQSDQLWDQALRQHGWRLTT